MVAGSPERQEEEGACHIASLVMNQRRDRKWALEIKLKPHLQESLPSARLHLKKAPQPLQMVPSSGDRGLVGDTSYSNPNLPLHSYLPKSI